MNSEEQQITDRRTPTIKKKHENKKIEKRSDVQVFTVWQNETHSFVAMERSTYLNITPRRKSVDARGAFLRLIVDYMSGLGDDF